MKKIILILSVLLLGNHSVYSDQFYQGSTGDDFYTGSMASRQPSSALDFTSKLPQYQPKKKKEFFNSALTPEFVGGFDEYDTKAVTQYYMFPMLIEEGQSAVFVGKIQGSDETVTLKDEEFLNVTVKKQLPIISGVLTLYVKKKKVEELTFKGNLMYIKQYPEDLLPTRQICEAKECCLRINLSRSTPGMAHTFDVNLSNGVCPVEESHPKYFKPETRPTHKVVAEEKERTRATEHAHALANRPKRKIPSSPLEAYRDDQYAKRLKPEPLEPQIVIPGEQKPKPKNPLEEYADESKPKGAYTPTTKKSFWSFLDNTTTY